MTQRHAMTTLTGLVGRDGHDVDEQLDEAYWQQLLEELQREGPAEDDDVEVES
jgi:hypothetical protein